MNEKIKEGLIYLLLPIILCSYTGLNYYLYLNGSTLCNSTGCNITKTILNVPVDYVYILGILGSTTLFILGIYSFIKKDFKLYNTLLLGMTLFETIFLSYLILKTEEICILCLIFYFLLLVTTFITYKYSEFFKVNPILIILMIIIPLLLLDIKKPKSIENQYTIIGTETCKHCKETKEKLAYLNFTSLDVKDTGDLLKTFNITTVPVLIVKNNDGIRVIEGKDIILKEFAKKEETNISTIPTDPFFLDNKASFMNKKEGCSIVEEVKCD